MIHQMTFQEAQHCFYEFGTYAFAVALFCVFNIFVDTSISIVGRISAYIKRKYRDWKNEKKDKGSMDDWCDFHK